MRKILFSLMVLGSSYAQAQSQSGEVKAREERCIRLINRASTSTAIIGGVVLGAAGAGIGLTGSIATAGADGGMGGVVLGLGGVFIGSAIGKQIRGVNYSYAASYTRTGMYEERFYQEISLKTVNGEFIFCKNCNEPMKYLKKAIKKSKLIDLIYTQQDLNKHLAAIENFIFTNMSSGNLCRIDKDGELRDESEKLKAPKDLWLINAYMKSINL